MTPYAGDIAIYITWRITAVVTDLSKKGLLQSHCSVAVMQGMYKASKKRFDDDADFKERARRAVTLLQGGDPEFITAWERICEASRKVRR